MRDMRLTIMTLGLTQFIFITRCDVIIAIDFDGTCVTHAYPGLGYDIGAIKHLKQLVANGHKLILNTMRSGEFLQEAVDWFAYNDIDESFSKFILESKAIKCATTQNTMTVTTAKS